MPPPYPGINANYASGGMPQQQPTGGSWGGMPQQQHTQQNGAPGWANPNYNGQSMSQAGVYPNYGVSAQQSYPQNPPSYSSHQGYPSNQPTYPNNPPSAQPGMYPNLHTQNQYGGQPPQGPPYAQQGSYPYPNPYQHPYP